jgi:hypothetical protein
MPVSLRSFRPAAAALLLLAPILAPRVMQAQVGHAPTKSPYEDYDVLQTLTLTAGQLFVGKDPAGVAPKDGLIGMARYDIRIGGPMGLFVRYMGAPSQRDELKPGNPRATRLIGTPSVFTNVIDGGFNLDLTGKKTFHRFLPSVFAGVGMASDFAKADSGQYSFGSNFSFSYGGVLRYIPRHGPQLRLDVSNVFWKYQYPDTYYVKASDTTSVLTLTRQRSAWRPNKVVSLGVTFPIFR